MVNEQHSVWKATTLTEDKNNSAQWFALHVVCPAVMEYLNSGKSPYFCVFTESEAVASGLALWSGRRTMETWPIKGMPAQGMILWTFEGHIKVGHVDAHQMNTCPGLKGNWN